jgi:hypothetical protein
MIHSTYVINLWQINCFPVASTIHHRWRNSTMTNTNMMSKLMISD